MNVLFTGHRGFLGRELIPKLSNDFNVKRFDGDLLNFQELHKFVETNRIEKIIHAAVRGGRRIRVDDHKVLEENLMASTNLLIFGLPLLGFCSGAIYGRQESLSNSKEIEAGDRYPSDYYGQSKFLFRQIAIDKPGIQFLRFFNVFGIEETPERFLKSNIRRYISDEPMQVYQDFYMDFFFVEDSLPLIVNWLLGVNLPKEINLVYQNKFLLSEICEKINQLDNHSVPIEIANNQMGKNYCGDGSLLDSQGLQMKGLNYGIEAMFKSMN